jgi:hypothetical protein
MLLVEWAQESNLLELTSCYNQNCDKNFHPQKNKILNQGLGLGFKIFFYRLKVL